jgi:hypothetical protein
MKKAVLLLVCVFATAATMLCQTVTGGTASSRTDVYHIHFAKAAAGKAAQMAEFFKSGGEGAPKAGHSIVLRHQDGADWDFVVIQHMGPSVTVDTKGNPMPPALRDLYDWHTDSFAAGPAWPDFIKAMGLGDMSGKSGGSVYVVSVYRSLPGHRDQLEKALRDLGPAGSDTSSGNVMLQHLEGGPWNYLLIARYNSWQDFATNEANSSTQTRKGQGGWFDIREHLSFHTDTLSERVSP